MDYRKFIVTEEYEGERIDKFLTKITKVIFWCLKNFSFCGIIDAYGLSA